MPEYACAASHLLRSRVRTIAPDLVVFHEDPTHRLIGGVGVVPPPTWWGGRRYADSEDDYRTGEHEEESNRKQQKIRGSPSVNPLRGWRRR